MLKTLFLSIMGWIRGLVNKNTNIRVAGKEHIHQVNQKIEALRAERNIIAGRGIGLERKRDDAEEKSKRFAEAVKQWDLKGDIDKRDRSYQEYKREVLIMTETNKQIEAMVVQIQNLDNAIAQLETETGKAEDNLNRAAAQQQYAKASEGVEDIHDLLNKGPLAEAAKAAEERGDIAEARRRKRKEDDKSDLLEDVNDSALSMDDLLGSKPTIRTVQEERQAPAIAYQEPVHIQTSHTRDRDVVQRHDDSHSSSSSNSSSSSFDLWG